MRIITGSRRGRKLKTLPGDAVRPTPDRVKEALFNILQFDLEGRVFLDLFAGSGQIGLEALAAVTNNPRLRDLPFYLETPNPELSGFAEEIALLRSAHEG